MTALDENISKTIYDDHDVTIECIIVVAPL